jgi:hypothetical protein
MGTIAGDDTIMIITAGAPQSRSLANRLLALAGRERTDPVHHPNDDQDPPQTQHVAPDGTTPTKEYP